VPISQAASTLNLLQHTATHYNTLQHPATSLQHHCNSNAVVSAGSGGISAYHSSSEYFQFTTPHCNTLQHTATHCNTLQHTATATRPSVLGAEGLVPIIQAASTSNLLQRDVTDALIVLSAQVMRVAVCCSMLQCVALCCSVLQLTIA